jgi:type I restriction enzyme, S subunit
LSWEWVSIGDAPLDIIDGDRGKEYPKQHEFLNDGPCLFLNTGNVTKSGFSFANTMFISEQKDAALRKGKLRRDDVIMTTRGTIGNCAYYHSGVPFESVRINSGMVIFRTHPENLTPAFLYQYLRSDVFDGKAQAIRSGAAQPQLPIRDIKTIELPLPPLPEQQRIAAILSAYDDLIENNRRRIGLLEEAARQLYKEWFVRFRFPGHEHVKIVDGVPEGWERGRVADLGLAVTGKTPSKNVSENFGFDVPFIKTPDMHGQSLIVATDECLSERGANSQANKTLPIGSILVSCIGTIGVVAMNAIPAQTNQQINAVIPKQKHWQFFAYFALQAIKPNLEAMGGGATMANVNKSKFENVPIVIADDRLILQFDEAVRPLFELVELLIKHSLQLAKARDLFLPRLMNGSLTV